MQKSHTSTDKVEIDKVEEKLKSKGYRLCPPGTKVKIGTYFRTQSSHSNPCKFEGPPSYSIEWGEEDL
jgi:hypothetical protein